MSARQTPWMRALFRILGNSQSINGLIEVGADKTYPILTYCAVPLRLTSLYMKTLSGTCTAKLQKNGVDITGLTALAVTSVRAGVTATAPSDGTNIFAIGDVLDLIITGSAAPLDLSWSITAAGL